MPSKQRPQYVPKTADQKLGYLVEEAGEVLSAAGKSLRWGLMSVNPELLDAKQETNRAWLWRELADLERAIRLIREDSAFQPRGVHPDSVKARP